nr:hypothetical protein [Tanacetum cinerariifolium]GEX22425.1 hypothetical protein [Tanacetum cinerariifolium]
MNNKKHIVNLESFRDMLHISPRIPGQSFDELPFEEKILEFIRYLKHSATIRTLTDVNINKLYQPWRSFAAIINKCLTGKSSGYDNFWLSQAQILWGLYHTRNIDYDFLIWEDFVYQVAHKNHKKSNEMYNPRFTKVIIHYFMSKDLSIPRRNKVNCHYVRDDFLFSTIKVVSRHQNTQQYGAMLPIELTNDEIRNTKAYKEYYSFATEKAVPKPKTSARRKRSDSNTSITPPTATPTPKPTAVATLRLPAAAKGKQPAKATKAKSSSAFFEVQMKELVLNQGFRMYPLMNQKKNSLGTLLMMKVLMNKERTKMMMKEMRENAEGGEDDEEEGESDEEDDNKETRDEESFDPIPKTPKSSEDEGDGKEDQGLNVYEEEHVEEEEEDKLYRDVNIKQCRGLQATLEVEDSHVTLTLVKPDGQQESSSVSLQFVTSMLNPTSDVGMKSIFATPPSSVAPLPLSTPIMTPSTIATITTTSQAPIPPTPVPSEVFQNLPTFALVFRFDDRLKSLEANFSEYKQTKPFTEAVSAISGIVHQYMNQQINEAVHVAVQIQTDRLRDSYQRENDEFLRTIDENMKRIIKEQVAADLSEIELKKILIEKMEGNKSIQCSDEQRNLYKALVDTYEADKIILDSYRETFILKRRRDDDDDDKDEGPFDGSDRGSKRRREGKEPESASAQLETATRSAGRSTTGSKSRQASANESSFTEEPVQTTSQIEEPSHLVFETGVKDQPIVHSSQHPEWFSQPQKPPTPDCDWNKTLPAVQGSTQTWIRKLAKQADTRSFFNELLDTPLYFFNFIMNRLRVDTLAPEPLAGPTYELMKGSCTSLIELEYHLEEVYKATTNQLDWVNPEDKKNKLMRIDELHKFSDGMFNDVRTALDDRLKGIRMQYLPQTIWRNGDKHRAAAMIQAIDKMLKTRRIMRSLEKFVEGRLYEGDFQMLQRTI